MKKIFIFLFIILLSSCNIDYTSSVNTSSNLVTDYEQHLISLGMNDTHAKKYCELFESTDLEKIISIEIENKQNNTYYKCKTKNEIYNILIDQNNKISISDENNLRIAKNDILNKYYLLLNSNNRNNITEFAKKIYKNFFSISTCIFSNILITRQNYQENLFAVSGNCRFENFLGTYTTNNFVVGVEYIPENDGISTFYLKNNNDVLVDTRNKITIDFKDGRPLVTFRYTRNYYLNDIFLSHKNFDNDNYTFDGWYIGNKPYRFNYLPTENTLIEAKLSPKYKTIFNIQADQQVENIQTFTLNVDYLFNYTLPIPSKNGYKFLGWYTIINNQKVFLTDSYGKSLSKNNYNTCINIYPEWEDIFNDYVEIISCEINESNDGYYITKFDGKGDIVFPDTYNGLPIVGIKRNSWKNIRVRDEIFSITFPKYIKVIDSGFLHYSSLSTCSIYMFFSNPDSIEYIGENNYITIKNTVSLGKNVKTIQSGFSAHSSFTISEDNPYLTLEGNGIYSKDGTILYNLKLPNEKNIYLSNRIEHISSDAFIYCNSITNLHLSDSLISVDSDIFHHLHNLTDIYCYSEQPISIVGDEHLTFTSSMKYNFHIYEELEIIPLESENFIIIKDIKK